MAECPNLEKCGFVHKYGETKDLAVKGFVKMYCHTVKQEDCKRKEFKKTNGVAPPDNMLPNGGYIKD